MDTIAKRYAEALFTLAQEENAVAQYQKDIEKVEAVFQDQKIIQFFSHVAIQDEDKYQVLNQCLKGQIETYVYQFLLLLIKKEGFNIFF
ncbi:F0F1 ATP synthase subunit delta [Allocoprobacillus halotolerans]|uniref:F0F1 ATP synthase subunit delta n=1 Tax=Allocoprobacillus halotolerans TaxID=2944914 RepID=A0ABY5I6N3_9FIRM|nr:F0F1 ATP synthase subunit delta [Allocoprobacillus halotolerans]UTY40368.1 F0F1 ATP synthase subunit delta [Allocoprobacillus halotolerans]